MIQIRHKQEHSSLYSIECSVSPISVFGTLRIDALTAAICQLYS